MLSCWRIELRCRAAGRLGGGPRSAGSPHEAHQSVEVQVDLEGAERGRWQGGRGGRGAGAAGVAGGRPGLPLGPRSPHTAQQAQAPPCTSRPPQPPTSMNCSSSLSCASSRHVGCVQACAAERGGAEERGSWQAVTGRGGHFASAAAPRTWPHAALRPHMDDVIEICRQGRGVGSELQCGGHAAAWQGRQHAAAPQQGTHRRKKCRRQTPPPPPRRAAERTHPQSQGTCRQAGRQAGSSRQE